MDRRKALKILQVTEASSLEDIKSSYRSLAKKYHPDLHKGNVEYEEKFKEISLAYETLTKQSQSSFNDNNPFEELAKEFEQFFNSPIFSRSRPGKEASNLKKPNPSLASMRFPDIAPVTLKVDIVSALFRLPIEFKLQVKSYCEKCLSDQDNWVECKNCKGTGQLLNATKTPFGIFTQQSSCPVCRELGWKAKHHCVICKDTLTVNSINTITFKVPEDFAIGSKIRLQGMGHKNWNFPNSDLIIEPIIPLTNFSKLQGNELERILNLLKTTSKD